MQNNKELNKKISEVMFKAKNIIINCAHDLEELTIEYNENDDADNILTLLIGHSITMMSCIAKSMECSSDYIKMIEISKVMVSEIILKNPLIDLPDEIRENLKDRKISIKHIKMFEDVLPATNNLPREVAELIMTEPIENPIRRNNNEQK